MNEYTTDVRDLDNLYLATIANTDYYEVRQIVKVANGRRETVGRASDWPIIQRDAQIAELSWLIASQERGRAEQDVLMVELACRLSAFEDELANATTQIGNLKAHIAALEAALAETAAERAAQDIQAHPTQFVVEPLAPHIEQLVERLKSGEPPQLPPAATPQAEQAFVEAAAPEPAALVTAQPHPCPDCPKSFVTAKALSGHRARVHGPYKQPSTPAHIIEALELPEAPWSCAMCHTNTHARSTSQPRFCIRCVVASVEHATNGHSVAA
jgi:hypothetical protein